MIETLFLGGRIFRTRKYHRGLPVESRYSWTVFRIPAPEKLEEHRYLPRISQKSVVCLHDGNAWQTTVLTIWGMYVQYTFNVHRISRGPLPKFCLTLCLAPRIVSENNAANTVDGSGILRSPVEVGSLSHYFRDFFLPPSRISVINRSPMDLWSGSCSRKTSPISPGILSTWRIIRF